MMWGMDARRRLGASVWRVSRSSARRFREGWRAGLTRTVRLTGAAIAAYLMAARLLEDPRPVTAALTALLIVQVTLVSTVADTARRILSVVAGVVVAIGFASVLGFSVASLALLITASLVVGQVLRLGDQLLEVPISAMLVLSVNGAHAAATDRIAETIVGAVAGLLVNLVFPPSARTRSAAAGVEGFAADLAVLLERAAARIGRQVTPELAQEWLAEARRLSNFTQQLDDVLESARNSRRLNPRAVGLADTGPDLRAGLDTLEHSAVALRALFRSVADIAGDQPQGVELFGEDVGAALSVLLFELAHALRSFGTLVRAEAEADEEGEGGHDDRARAEKLAATLDAVREPRARLAELLLIDPRADPNRWEQHGALLAAVERVLREVDIEEHARQRQRRRAAVEDAQTNASHAAARLRTATKQVTDLPFRWRN